MMPSSVAHIQTERRDKNEADKSHDECRQHEKCSHLGGRSQHRSLVHPLLLALIVMPLDGEKHGHDKRNNLKRTKNDREPIHIKDFHAYQLRAL